jgi:ElaB/YqjD/DUF883 family membrane-anchored ribosome-binding protein
MDKIEKGARKSKAEVDRAVRDTEKGLKKKIHAIKSELNEKGPDAAEKSLSGLRAILEDDLDIAHEDFEKAHDSFDDMLESGVETIREKPLISIGVALAVGILLGALLERKK